LVINIPVGEGSVRKFDFDLGNFTWSEILDLVETLEDLWRSITILEIVSLWNSKVNLSDFRASNFTNILYFESDGLLIVVDLETIVLKFGVGKSKSELEARFDLVLIVPSVSEMMLLRVSRVPVIVSSWVLGFRHLLFVVNIWHSEGKLSRWIHSSEKNIHKTFGIFLSRHDVEEKSISNFFQVI